MDPAAAEMLETLECGRYTAPSGAEVPIAEAQAAAVAGTCIYTPAELEVMVDQLAGPFDGRLEVTDETVQQAAHALAGRGEGVAVLNFASAYEPGGGFLEGSKAQEEDICRCSGLYPTLLTQPIYYDVNRAQTSPLYTDHAIFSPAVPFLKTRGRGPWLERPILASVITMPAPDTGTYLAREPDGQGVLRDTFARRWRAVFAVAREREVRCLVLGAWGCGAFGGDPAMAATTAREALATSGADLSRVRFAVPGRGPSATHLDVFRRVLADSQARDASPG